MLVFEIGEFSENEFPLNVFGSVLFSQEKQHSARVQTMTLHLIFSQILVGHDQLLEEGISIYRT